MHRQSLAVVDILPPEADSTFQSMGMSEKPDVTYAGIGGMDIQKEKSKEAVERPLDQLELYAQVGIHARSAVLYYGPPGTCKTVLAKAVANQTTAVFIRMVGSEFVRKYIGEGPRMVRDVFRFARENAPVPIFIDEITRAHNNLQASGLYEFFAQRQLITMGSAPNYCGKPKIDMTYTFKAKGEFRVPKRRRAAKCRFK